MKVRFKPNLFFPHCALWWAVRVFFFFLSVGCLLATQRMLQAQQAKGFVVSIADAMNPQA